jgi:hypothetical protein
MGQTILLPLCIVIVIATVSFGQSPQAAAPPEKAGDRASSVEKDGTLVLLVTWGDVDNTPADDVYVEAYGFVRKYNTSKSFVLKMSKAGRYEASLPPGVYDVFVSEGTSEPRCRRVLIGAGSTGYWTLKLEIDEVYTDQMARSNK